GSAVAALPQVPKQLLLDGITLAADADLRLSAPPAQATTAAPDQPPTLRMPADDRVPDVRLQAKTLRIPLAGRSSSVLSTSTDGRRTSLRHQPSSLRSAHRYPPGLQYLVRPPGLFVPPFADRS